uniref:SPEF2 C-terminal domain-containing protein n=1 Tax=Strombidium rassoulzadegani TaxID=1082188 RepID=A0A7S3FXA7_9SPIT|mmetsp:Transcript_6416/g.10891  ORF Transcript_6416/g.10891 Transcript_6416/m.10891 type:complete len:217 (+) Transcript_6416:771-1421(+)
MDFFVDKGILNFIEPPPEKLAALEEKIDGRFNIPQLKSLVSELKMVGDDDGCLSNRKTVEILLRKLQNSKSFADMGGLPKEWDGFTQNEFEKMVRNLDSSNQGRIDYRVLAICCILLKSPLPTKEAMDQLRKQLGLESVKREQFTKAKFWFEKTEGQRDREYSHPFPRVELLKGILFDLAQQNGEVACAPLLDALQLKAIRKGKSATYGEVLTADV